MTSLKQHDLVTGFEILSNDLSNLCTYYNIDEQAETGTLTFGAGILNIDDLGILVTFCQRYQCIMTITAANRAIKVSISR